MTVFFFSPNMLGSGHAMFVRGRHELYSGEFAFAHNRVVGKSAFGRYSSNEIWHLHAELYFPRGLCKLP